MKTPSILALTLLATMPMASTSQAHVVTLAGMDTMPSTDVDSALLNLIATRLASCYQDEDTGVVYWHRARYIDHLSARDFGVARGKVTHRTNPTIEDLKWVRAVLYIEGEFLSDDEVNDFAQGMAYGASPSC